MIACTATTGYPPRRTSMVYPATTSTAVDNPVPIHPFRAIVSDVSPKRDRRFTVSVTD